MLITKQFLSYNITLFCLYERITVVPNNYKKNRMHFHGCLDRCFTFEAFHSGTAKACVIKSGFSLLDEILKTAY